ncbi:MAG TPA: hypothetical protein VGG42_17070 [Acidobacteriaceae bacterium]|jgi:hypothetical protein
MPTTVARQKLAEAIAVSATAKDSLASAESILAVAKAAVDDARAALAQFDGLDAAIAGARLDALKGGDAARLETLSARQRDRLLAKEELSSAESTLELARGELEEAQAKAAELLPAVNTAATAVIADEVQQVALQLKETSRRVEYLRGLLRGLFVLPPNWQLMPESTRKVVIQGEIKKAGLPFGNSSAWERLSGEIAASLADKPGDGDRRADKWKDFADAILQDPEADVSILL